MDCAFADFLQVCIAINAAPVPLHEVVQESLHQQIDRKIERLLSACEKLTPGEANDNPYLVDPIRRMREETNAAWGRLDIWAPRMRTAMVLCALLSVGILYVMEYINYAEVNLDKSWWVTAYLPKFLWLLLLPFAGYCGVIMWADSRIRNLINQEGNRFEANAKTAISEGERLKDQALEKVERGERRPRSLHEAHTNKFPKSSLVTVRALQQTHRSLPKQKSNRQTTC